MGYSLEHTEGENQMNRLQWLVLGIVLGLASLAGCGTEDDDEMMTPSEDTATMSDPDEGLAIGGDCSCEEGESICNGGCPTGLTCAALSCTVSCDDDRPCPDGSRCTPISSQDFDERSESVV